MTDRPADLFKSERQADWATRPAPEISGVIGGYDLKVRVDYSIRVSTHSLDSLAQLAFASALAGATMFVSPAEYSMIRDALNGTRHLNAWDESLYQAVRRYHTDAEFHAAIFSGVQVQAFDQRFCTVQVGTKQSMIKGEPSETLLCGNRRPCSNHG